MTPMTAAIARSVVAPAISISHRTFATMRAAAGSRGAASSAESLLMALQGRSERLVIAAEEVGERLDRVLAHRVAELRSEEHTSELQSLRHLVCRLLLEKKKNRKRQIVQE